MREIIAELVRYIRDETGFMGDLGPDEDLIQSGVLDSFNIVALALFVQDRFGVELDGEDLVRDNLAKLSALAALIDRRRSAQG